MRRSPTSASLRSSMETIARIALAIVGGYVTVAIWTFLLGRILPGDRAGAGLTATMLSFALYAACVVGVFGARHIGRAAAWMLLVAAVGGIGIALT